MRYIDSYRDDESEAGRSPVGSREIGSFFTADTQYALGLGGGRGPTLSFGALNLLDRKPPHVSTNGGYDSKVHDPRGRLLYARADFSF